MDSALRTRLLYPLGLVAATVLVGTLGFYLLWRDQGGTWLDALYMTIITITTIGYEEVYPLDTAGRLLAMGVGLVGIGSLFYAFSVVMDTIVSVRLRPRERMGLIKKLSDHVILVGLGRVGRQAAQELKASGVPFVVVDKSEAARAYAEEHGYLLLQRDGTEDEALLAAGVERAQGLIATASDDATNLYVVLSARRLNPRLYIVSRASDEKAVPKLLRAGADRAVSPYAIGGKRLAHLLLSPRVVDFFETILAGKQQLGLEEIRVEPGSSLVHRPIREVQARGCRASILAVFRGSEPHPNPSPDFVLEAEDRLLAMGTVAELDRLEALARGGEVS
jgi:voltage-gated potassium channel